MPLLSAAQTDIGLARSENEDRMLCADDLALYAVADGIGGLPGGAEAAQTAITALLKSARDAVQFGQTLDLVQAFKFANSEVIDLAHRFAPDTGLGTTMTAGHIHEGTLRVVNVGDSRCYLFRNGRLRLLTTDDTVEHEVAVRRSRGEVVELEDRYRNALTRCIGQPMPLDVRASSYPLQPGDRVLFCSDGITRMIADSALARRLGQAAHPSVVLGGIVADALAAGGNDNITGVIVEVTAS